MWRGKNEISEREYENLDEDGSKGVRGSKIPKGQGRGSVIFDKKEYEIRVSEKEWSYRVMRGHS